MNNLILKINKIQSEISEMNELKRLSLDSCIINQKNPKGEKHDGFSFVFHGMAAKPLVADKCGFCKSVLLSRAKMDSAGKAEKTIDFETEKHKGQKAQRQKQSQKAQAIGVSICCKQTIKAS